MSDASFRRIQRRGFTKHTAAFALALLAVVGTLGLLGCGPQASSLAQASSAGASEGVPAKVVIVSDKEPGEPMIVSGTIYAPDGRTPLGGIDLFVYQTDATGRYSTSGNGGDNRNTRIHGLVRSGFDGRYEFRTIKPAPYPDGGNPAHIHAYVSGAGYPEYWIDEFLFEGDPFITDDAVRKFGGKGSFSSILSLKKGTDGVLGGVRDIKVERCTTNCTKR